MKLPRNILLTPGPATTTDTVKAAQLVPDICPREATFTAVVREIQGRLLRVAGADPTTHACILFGGSGTAAVEAALSSCVPAEGAVAVVVNGAYGQRMVDILTAYGIPNVPMVFPATQPLPLADLRATLARNPSVRALAMVHHETTTGLLNPLRAVGRLAREAGCIFIVDAISSLGGVPLSVVEDGVDLLISVGNKCLQGLPGVSFVLAGHTVLQTLRSYPQRSYYLNLLDQHDSLVESGQMRFTAPVHALYALRQALIEWDEEGGASRIARYQTLARVLRDGLRAQGFQLLLQDDWSAPVMTSVLEPAHPDWRFSRVHDELLARGFTIYPGKLTGLGTFRLATLGDLRVEDVQQFLAALHEVFPAGHGARA